MQLKNFAGLSKRAPGLSLCLLVFLLSLGGIPPLAGFIGKFFLFSATVLADEQNLGLLWLVILAIAMSAVSLLLLSARAGKSGLRPGRHAPKMLRPSGCRW